MYQDLFTSNFFLNFIPSFLFIIFNILFSHSFSLNMKKKGILFFDEFQPLVIFFLIFIFYSLVLNFLILIDFYNFFNIIFYLIIIIQIIFFSKNIDCLKSKNFKSFYGNKIEKFIILFFFFVFFDSYITNIRC